MLHRQKKLAAVKAQLEADKQAINHTAEWREYVDALRKHLRLSLTNGSKYNTSHASAVDGR